MGADLILDNINVIWYAEGGDEHSRTNKNCIGMLNSLFDKYNCIHWAGRTTLPDTDGAVVVVHGEDSLSTGVEKLNEDLAKYKWVIVIVLGDERHQFPAHEIQHCNMKIWIQEPVPGTHEYANRFILDGWTPYCKREDVEKDLDWVFAGQVTHERRRDCVNYLKRIHRPGILIETAGYTQGVSLPEYFRLLSRAKIVLCPSGPNSPDAARAWEALECGAIPILDERSPVQKGGFWKLVIPDSPLPRINSWDEMPELMSRILDNYAAYHETCLSWWDAYKRDWYNWLTEDITCLKSQC
jgi:hypothetical protein